ncbi:hypothetical protein AZF37_06885 [endosymbiont 'TC1' of Trimyema compressum]|uniref:tRNA (adenosine(37)-N6)-threonylcarbamoyltransferase complex ATPase subunit type 1 TsaE n=1 Tax=endosymbiont 'TC1' of Trimyema compressum TaxID=243899 RepID=UPI0007F04EA7|nr:tRNA (adenosine(37)-N6)-threonylcarbamoyltransferase complex ATPase subunit type 1 TsaE [endosymbiont 'TC1' of Trimyema compressum]AMP20924.1 hypothetical protein AZF37_06885 [endosymbiont 'TC1' of Trimyema compressum]
MDRKLLLSHSSEETILLGEQIGRQLKKGTVLELIGDLGAGKTNLSKGLALGLGSKDMVTSPTFSLMQIYSGDSMPIYHIDGYRLENEEAAYMSGLEDAFMGDGIAIVEWGDVVRTLYDGNIIEVEIKKLNETEREIEIRGDIDGFSWD